MNREEYEKILKTSLRRSLTAQEEERLRAGAVLGELGAGDLETELELNRALRELEVRPVSSNFTAQVLGAVLAGERAGRAREYWWWLRPSWRWVYSVAGAVGVLAISWVAYFEHENVEREARARSLATFSSVAAVPTVDMLKDFDAISKLSEAPDNSDFNRWIGALR